MRAIAGVAPGGRVLYALPPTPASVAARYRSLSMLSFRIFDSSVDAGTPRREAAPRGPDTRPRRELRQLLRRGRTSLAIGLPLLGASVAGGELVARQMDVRPLAEVLRESLVIGWTWISGARRGS